MYNIDTVENCELVETMFINYKDEKTEDFRYPTVEEGIAYIETKNLMKLSLSEILTIFYEYMKNPI